MIILNMPFQTMQTLFPGLSQICTLPFENHYFRDYLKILIFFTESGNFFLLILQNMTKTHYVNTKRRLRLNMNFMTSLKEVNGNYVYQACTGSVIWEQ